MKPTIIIPDIHQNFRFLDKVLELHEAETVERYVFLGDFFDGKEAFYSDSEALEKTLKTVEGLIQSHSEKVLLILGNHDVVYFFCREGSGMGITSRNQLQQYYGIPDRTIMTLIRELELERFWETFQLCHYEQGYLLSHAGVTNEHWSSRFTVAENVDRLNFSIGNLLDTREELKPLFRAGYARGGDLEKGGPLWLDWNREFSEEIGIPQIVGHTVANDYRQIGRSYCLDARQRCYGILLNNELQVRYV